MKRDISRIKGMDVSTLIEEEQCGAKFYDGGEAEDLFEILKRHGVNSVRLRLWNDPYDEDGTPYGAGTNDFEKTVLLARRAKAAGMSWLLDFHYSDFWADPGKQIVPKAWKGHDAAKLAEDVYVYTHEILTKLKALDLEPFMVQVGNEITNGCLWPLGNRHYGRPEGAGEGTCYYNPILKDILNAGIKAVREVCPDAIVMLHLDNGGNNAMYRDWFDGYFAAGGTDFDVIGLSYYPFWHGSIKMLTDNMNDISVRYDKDLIIDEVSMGFTMEDYAEYEKLAPDERKGYATRPSLIDALDYPMTVQGQVDFMKKINEVIDGVPDGHGKGYYYWEPAWVPVPGCGWATEAALRFTGEKGPGGNEWANQALFDYNGHALPALSV